MDPYNPENILPLSIVPEHKEAFNTWVQQKDVLNFLEKEIEDENIIIYASLPHVFMHAVLIHEVKLNDSTIEDLLGWSHNPYSTWGITCSQDDAWIEGPLSSAGSKILSSRKMVSGLDM